MTRSPITLESPVIIVGGGIVGLALAQALKQASIPFQVYEWDPDLDASSRSGWAITIHWALAALKECLPPAMFERLKDIQVDPEQGIKDTGKFLFLDMATAKPKYVIPPSTRMRVNRGMLRGLLAQGIDVRWNKVASGFKVKSDDQHEWVEVSFEDGTITRGSLLIGADGANSRTRRTLVGDDSASSLIPLPVKAMGVTMHMTPAQITPLREIDPLLFQGCHPQTGVFLWYSTVSTPEINGSSGDSAFYEGQLIVSWRYTSPADQVPSTNAARLAKMKAMVQPFEHRIKAAVEAIPDHDVDVLELKLQDWPTQAWDNRNGRVTLAGDAAHPMTMYRGEAFNHGITDAANLSRHLISVVTATNSDEPSTRQTTSLREAVTKYETELRTRGHDAALLSRQACLDAHDLHNLNSDSPLVSRRARVLKPGVAVD
ncbi:hypothetical protein DV737_g3532, partial [Chaetothyriales sp. CBS 132003]